MDQRSSTTVHATSFVILFAISFCHLLNDMMSSLLAAIYPNLKDLLDLSFTQIGLITLTYNITASFLQPIVGLYSDKRPAPFSLPAGMVFNLSGLIMLATVGNYPLLILGAALLGLGSAVFHPESSRVARMASGGRHGVAQSLFQVGGNAGQALGPLMAALVVASFGRGSIAWFGAMALVAIAVLTGVGFWYREHGLARMKAVSHKHHDLSRAHVARSIAVLLALIFSKQVYIASISSYYTFYLIHHFGVSVRSAQTYLFVFMAMAAAGTLAGGFAGDRFGRKFVIWFSVLGCLPFALALPYVDLLWTSILTAVIGAILSCAFPAILVYAQELVPGKVGTISGLFFGFAFGMGGLGAAVLGVIADASSIEFVYRICALLPLIGILAGLLPKLETARR